MTTGGGDREPQVAGGLGRAPRRFSRFRLGFFDLAQRASVALGGRRLYRATQLRAGRFRIRHEIQRIARVDSGFDRLRIVQLTDMHAGPFLGAGDLRDVCAAVTALRPDVVVLTGDYISDQTEQAFDLVGDLSLLEARLGIFAVFGNHDYRARREGEIAECYGREAGVEFLRNSGRRIPLRHDVDAPALFISGVEDVEEGRDVDIAAARRGRRGGDVEICLCHNPLAAPALADSQCAAVFSGHTHGYQINLPLVRRLAPAHPGGRRDADGTALICSNGLGALGLPLRVRARAEVVLLELRVECAVDEPSATGEVLRAS